MDAARALGARFGTDVGHGERVLVHGRRLLAGSIDAFARPDQARAYRLRLDLAAVLHDVGRAVAGRRHNRHSRYLIVHSDRTEPWPEDLRNTVAELSRAHRGPASLGRLRRRLGGDDDLVRLAALLRIADGLDRSHMPGVAILAFGPGPKGFSLSVAGLPEGDRRRLVERKADLFAQAFGRCLRVRVIPSPPRRKPEDGCAPLPNARGAQ